VREFKTKDYAWSWTFQSKSCYPCLVLWSLPSFSSIFLYSYYQGSNLIGTLHCHCHVTLPVITKLLLVYTTQVNSAFRARWFASSEVISQVLFTSEQSKTKWLPVSNKVTLKQVKLLFGPLVIQLVWYILKTIIHLSVGESGGYLPPL